MATIAEQLTQLQNDKQVLVDNLVAKGVEASSDETFTTLAPKVADIEAGGGGEDYFDLNYNGSGGLIAHIKKIPLIDFSEKTSMTSYFSNARSLEAIPQINTSKCLNFNACFYNCSSLKTVPLFDTSKATDVNNLFSGCTSLEEVPELDFSSATATSNIFYSSGVKHIKTLNCPKATSIQGVFQNCSNLETIEEIIMGEKTTNMNNTFNHCDMLVNIPFFDTSRVTIMNSTFRYCGSLEELPQYDTSNNTDFQYCFQYCYKLKKIPLLECGNVSNFSIVFYNNTALTDLGGFKDLGKGFDASITTNNTKASITLMNAPNLTHESIVNVINNVYDIKTLGLNTQQIRVDANQLALLTPEEIAVATDKGWTVM